MRGLKVGIVDSRKYPNEDPTKEEFQKTKNHNEIYKGLKKLKDLCIKVAGGFPLKWEKQK